ncbi:hypothetical protein AB1L07_02620 [Niallia alba]|uniref:hypothetical protein n=1 Tax=Niallia alba TaxID=2729105 RepID=UPI00399F4EB5
MEVIRILSCVILLLLFNCLASYILFTFELNVWIGTIVLTLSSIGGMKFGESINN